ncbi:MAG: YqeG family HAD IIIA-type phosphatase [Candidatus Margulisbacteria bacterium]|nr:YqeG family HAD IIIA-type phosphatase [Candidatus Margulisiibacteriota bacterium]
MSGSWNNLSNLFQPKLVVNDIHEINFKALKDKGIEALILDIDDTLLPRTVNDISPQVFEWVVDRKNEGFRLCLTSNSRHPLRVKYIGDTLGLPAMSLGFKPLPFAFWNSMKILQSKPENTAMIGDQLFMDILGANLLNIFSIYVKHLTEETFIFRKWMRLAEAWVLGKPRPGSSRPF